MQDDMVQVGHSRGIFDLSNCFCLDLNLEYVLMDFISRGSKFQATVRFASGFVEALTVVTCWRLRRAHPHNQKNPWPNIFCH